MGRRKGVGRRKGGEAMAGLKSAGVGTVLDASWSGYAIVHCGSLCSVKSCRRQIGC